MRVLDAFEPDHIAPGKAIRMGGAVADRKDVGQHRAAVFVDVDLVGARNPGGDQRADGRNDADADHHHLAGKRGAIGEAYAGDLLAVAFDRLDQRLGAQIDAVRAVLGLVERGKVFPRDPRQHARQGFEQGHLAAELGQHRRGLEPDIAAANHHHPLRPRIELGHHPVGIGEVADVVDPSQLGAGAGQPPRIAAGGPDQRSRR